MRKLNKCITLFFTVIFSLIILKNNAAPLEKVPTIEEFEKLVKKDTLLIKMKDNGPLTEMEKIVINQALKDQNTKYTPRINRDIKNFKGVVLLVGGGKKGGKDKQNKGLANIEKAIEENNNAIKKNQKNIGYIELDIKLVEKNKFHNKYERFKVSPLTSVALNQDNKQLIIKLHDLLSKEKSKKFKSNKEISQEILDMYYTIDIDATVDPDLVTSATDIKGLKFIPDKRFNYIHYEEVNTFVFLNPNTWKFLERVCKPRGMIQILSGLYGFRLLPIIIKGTKWEKTILEQLENNYKKIKTKTGLELFITNE